jgi:nucleotide-binding universal stress UspA family protein
MSSIGRNRIIVGVTGRGRERSALQYAVECARRDDAEVLLVHAFPMPLASPPLGGLMVDDTWRDVATSVVSAVCEEFQAMTRGTVPCRTVVGAGSPSDVIVALSAKARCVVLQHRKTSTLGRIFVGSTVNGAAAHAHCPVLSVPEDWTSSGEPEVRPTDVVVGVDEGGGPPDVLAAAVDHAAATGARLRVVYAWHVEAAYDDIVSARVVQDWQAQRERTLSQAVEQVTADGPEVLVRVEVRRQWPAQALVDLSRTAGLVIVGRHASHGWLTGHLGSTPRAVLREARSPVMVVPVSAGAQPPDDWGLSADEVAPQA